MVKYTVITGASSGIGKAVAQKLVALGKNLILAARGEAILADMKQALEKEYGVSVIVKKVDLASKSELVSFYDSLNEYDLETFINNAGFGKKALVDEMNLTEVDQMIEVNIKALVYLSTKFVRDYKNVPGTTLINVSSLAGYAIFDDAVDYSATKFFVSAFTEGLAKELEVNNNEMKVKILAPGPLETKFEAIAKNIDNVNYKETFSKFHTAEEMAGFLIDLLNSDQLLGKVNRDTLEFNLKSGEYHKIGFE